MITPEQVAVIRTFDLRKTEVQQAFAGFLHQELYHIHNVDISGEELSRVIALYVEAAERALDRAVEIMNQQNDILNSG